MRTTIVAILTLACATGWFFVHFEARRRRHVLTLTLFFDLLVGALVAVAALSAPTFEGWMQEDAWAEWATVYGFAGAAALVALRLWRWRRAPEAPGLLPQLGLLGVALFCLFVAGEEISWGQRLLAFEPPEVFLRENYQQELNLHNLLKDKKLAGFSLDSRFLVALIAVVYGGVLPVLRKLGRLRQLQPTIDAVAPPWELAPWFGGVALTELAYPTDLAGEACELVLGVLFLAAAVVHLHANWSAQPDAGTVRRDAVVLTAPFVLGIATEPVVSAVLYGADEELVAQTQAELTQLKADLFREGVVKPRLRKKSRVHKRLFTAVQAGYFEPGADGMFLEGRTTAAVKDADDPRRDRKGYFLDPWNNPYWIIVTKKGRRGALYSFGPNRRRDTKMPKKKVPEDLQASGDDVLVGISLAPFANE